MINQDFEYSSKIVDAIYERYYSNISVARIEKVNKLIRLILINTKSFSIEEIDFVFAAKLFDLSRTPLGISKISSQLYLSRIFYLINPKSSWSKNYVEIVNNNFSSFYNRFVFKVILIAIFIAILHSVLIYIYPNFYENLRFIFIIFDFLIGFILLLYFSKILEKVFRKFLNFIGFLQFRMMNK